MVERKIAMKKIIKKVTRKLGLEIRRSTPNFDKTALVSLKSENGCQGRVLLSYVIEPFLLKSDEPVPDSHTHYWESLQMARTFLNLGYSVDVISYRNKKFIPKKNYSLFVSARTNFTGIARRLNEDCLKIVHLDTAHWLFNDTAAYNRCLAVKQKRGVALRSYKWVEPNEAIEYADCATVLGNDFTIGTYSYAQKPIFRLSIPTCTVYPWPEDKNYETCRNRFLWMGSSGLVHKGLGLVLEAFAQMPDHHLTVCGPISKDENFEQAFYKELYQTPNIHTVGWIDVTSPKFSEITNKCIGLVYPSASEGQAGAVVTCLQAGLIPIISYESGVDVDDFGLILRDCSIDEIKNSIQMVSNLSVQKLELMAHKAWKFARENHTREKYAAEYQKVIEKIIAT